MTMAGRGEVEESYLAYKDVSGIPFPSQIVITQNGQKRAEIKVDEVTLNPAIPDNTFAKP